MKNIQKLLQLIVENRDREKQLRAEQTATGNVVWLYDIIDSWFGVSALDVGKAIENFGGADFDLYLNSPGGDVFEGRAIQTLLRRHPGNVTVHIDGLAASAATTVALGGNKRIIADGAFFMVHNSWTLGLGDRNDLRKTADLLEQADDAIGSDYAAATGEERSVITQWMDDESWFNAARSVELGFADEIFSGDDSKAAQNRAAWNLSAYHNVPKDIAAPPEPQFSSREKLGRYVDMIERIG